MPVHSREVFLDESIESILSQTFNDLELIIICEDPTNDICKNIDNYREKSKKINVHYQESHGLAEARNIGCKLARGKYIAWMDSDDISLPERLEKQFEFMEAHPDVGICGTRVRIIDGHSNKTMQEYPTTDREIQCELFFRSALANSSVIMQRKLIESMDLPFDIEYKLAEDYDLWVRASKLTHFANLDDVLVLYRLHSESISQKHQTDMQKMTDKIRLNQLINLGIDPSGEEAELHNSIASWKFSNSMDFVEKSDVWLSKIQSINQARSCYPEPTFSNALAKHWFAICNHASSLGHWTWKTYWNSQLSKMSKLSSREKIMFALKCGMKYART
jgi:glycosyltransferase involved in cell wall biosynthesis